MTKLERLLVITGLALIALAVFSGPIAERVGALHTVIFFGGALIFALGGARWFSNTLL